MIKRFGEVTWDEKAGAGTVAVIKEEAGEGEGEENTGSDIGDDVAGGEIVKEKGVGKVIR